MESITLVKDAIHRPEEPRHFMQYKFPDNRYVASQKGQTLANSRYALLLSEVGYAIYDPVVYFPLEDVSSDLLVQIDKTTYCPLKGNTAYFNLNEAKDDSGKEIAWSYANPLPFAEKLQNYMAFDVRKVKIDVID